MSTYRPPMHQRPLPPGFKNYVILAPRATHFRPATCAEVQCRAFTIGWETHLDESTQTGQDLAQWIRGRSHGNQFTEWRAEGSTITVFRFPPFQPQPFGPEHRQHVIRTDRPEIFAFRDETTGFRLKQHRGAENGARDWVDDFATNQDAVATDKQRKGI
ncbi:MAG TPA: hypothetical protein VJ625_17145 [Propionibacteriaceae bacterium]|nr:hypothetical protein [Propionibacteriaceae bacterium]